MVGNKSEGLLQACISSISILNSLKSEPTRITSSSSTLSLIDLFLTNEPNNFMTAGVSTIGISDHNFIYAVRKHSTSIKSKPITIQCRNYKDFNENNFKRDIESVPWHFVGSYDDPIKAWETWKKIFLQIANKHAPFKKRRVRKISAPWLTAEIKKLMWERDHLKRKAVITKDESHWLSFKTKKKPW